MNPNDTLADVVNRYADQLKAILPTAQSAQYGYSGSIIAEIGRDRLVEIAPALVAYSEAVLNLARAKSLTPAAAPEQDGN